MFYPPQKTNKHRPRIDGWKMKFPFNMVPFQGHVDFRVCVFFGDVALSSRQ